MTDILPQSPYKKVVKIDLARYTRPRADQKGFDWQHKIGGRKGVCVLECGTRDGVI